MVNWPTAVYRLGTDALLKFSHHKGYATEGADFLLGAKGVIQCLCSHVPRAPLVSMQRRPPFLDHQVQQVIDLHCDVLLFIAKFAYVF